MKQHIPFNQDPEEPRLTTQFGGWGIMSIGAILTVFILTEPLISRHEIWLIEIIELCLSLTLIFSGYRLTQSELAPQYRQTIETWTFGGMIVFSTVIALTIFIEEIHHGSLSNSPFRIQTVLTSGTLLGFIIGTASILGSSQSSVLSEVASDEETPADHQYEIPVETFDVWLELLSNRRSRRIFQIVATSPNGVMTSEELSTILALEEFETRQQATLHLRHAILPKFADSGIIDYDSRTDTVRYWSNPAFEHLLDTIDDYDPLNDTNIRCT